VPQTHIEDNFDLGQWLVNQRLRRRRLSEDRITRLENLSGWVWVYRDADWEEGFTTLQACVKREGNAQVPQSHVEDGIRLGHWVRTQRGKKEKLPEERRIRLEGLPGWTWNTLISAWETGFAQLSRYVERECPSRVPQKHIEDGFKLGQWVSNQRARKSNLSEEQIAMLETCQWVWDPR